MMKVCFKSAKSLVDVFKVSGRRPYEAIYQMNQLRVANLSYVSHNNEHNVGAPPPKSPPKVHISVDNPKNNLSNKTTRKDDPRRDTTDYVAEKAKRGTKGVVETAFDAGATVAEGMEKSWGTIKETTEKIKDSVVGNEDDENNEKCYGGNSSGDHGYVDKHIDDLRRKGNGYDQRSY